MRFTAATVNRILKAAGVPERIVQGDGYAFFTGGNAPLWQESGVYGINRISDVPDAIFWLSERNRLNNAWEERKLPADPDADEPKDGVLRIRF
jgi:hypothetical protein